MMGHRIDHTTEEIPVKTLVDFYMRSSFLGDLIGLRVCECYAQTIFVMPIRNKQTDKQLLEEKQITLEGWEKENNAKSSLTAEEFWNQKMFRYAFRAFDSAAVLMWSETNEEKESYRTKLIQALKENCNLKIIDGDKTEVEINIIEEDIEEF